MKKASDYITKELEYERPLFDFPDLRGEQGNPIIYWKEFISIVNQHGFKKEAEFIKRYSSKEMGFAIAPQIRYEEQFDYINKYVDFSQGEEQVEEDDEYIYIRKKKSSISLKQLPIFKNISTPKSINLLINNEEDLSVTNCYNRNILYYIDDTNSLKHFLELNKEHKWVDIFHLDYFNSTALTFCNNLDNFKLLLEEMHNTNPEVTKLIFTGNDVFGINACQILMTHFDNLLCRKNQTEITDADWKKFVTAVDLVRKINIDIYNDVVDMISEIPIIKNDTTGKMEALKRYALLDLTIEKKENITEKKKLKL